MKEKLAKYTLQCMLAHGLEARWVYRKLRTTVKNGRQITTRIGKKYKDFYLVARHPNARTEHQRRSWWVVDEGMFKSMERIGVLPAFDEHTILGDILSVPVGATTRLTGTSLRGKK